MSFHPGWKAYEINSEFSMFNVQFHEAFPMLFGTELKEHVLVNNWANGFLLRPDAVGASEGQGSRTFIIIFWPQYLQFVGFGVLGLTIISFATLYLRDVLRRRKRLI